MSEQKLVSPLLDGFVMGAPMSNHDGIRCCPALKENSDEKYIVKIISVPASQVQLDALLLTGAYKDPAEAMDYFKEQTDLIVEEVQVLQKLSRLEGFLPYTGWQVEPMENGRLGYRVFLISSYKRTLDKFLRRSLMTHQQAVNLGLDLCAALAICQAALPAATRNIRPGNSIPASARSTARSGSTEATAARTISPASFRKFRSMVIPPKLFSIIDQIAQKVNRISVVHGTLCVK